MDDQTPKSAPASELPQKDGAVAIFGGDSKKQTGESSDTRGFPAAVDSALVISAIYDRLQKLESSPKTKKDHWYDSQLISTVLSGIILALFGYFLTGQLEQAAKEREISVQSASDMQQVIAKFDTGTDEDSESAALALSAYGRYSIPILIEKLQDPAKVSAAEDGLKVLALTTPIDLCSALGSVLQNRTQLYTAASQNEVVDIMGAANCSGKPEIRALREFADLIERADTDTSGHGMADYKQAVRDATAGNVADAKVKLKNTLQLLHENYAF